MTPVVILNMHYSGLGIARSLGPAGVPIFGLSSNPDFPGNFSRYCQFRLSPDSLLEQEKLQAYLLDLSSGIDGRAILLPTRDHDIEFLLRHRDALEERFVIPLASRTVIDRAMNKDACAALASRCGIAVPRSYTIRNGDELRALEGKLTFPVIVKPLYARQWRRPGVWEAVGHQKVALFDSFEGLVKFYAAIEAMEPTAAVQEYIPGPESNLVVFGSYCRPGGKVRAYFTGRKLLQDPPLKGTGVVVEGVPVPEIAGPSRALLREMGFFGISEIEFKIHERTAVPYFIEINPRHWDQHHLGTVCGVNLSRELYKDLTEPARMVSQPHADEAPLQSANPVRWIAEEDLLFFALSGVFRGDRSVRQAVRCMRGRRTFSVTDARDPGPGWKLIRNLVSRMLHIPAKRSG